MIFISKKKLEIEVSKRAMESCEQITSEMGAELHDDLIQKLSIFRLYIDRLERSSSRDAETETIVNRMRSDFEAVVQSIRKISRRLMPVTMDGDSFQTRIDILCQNMERPGTGNVHFQATGQEQHLPVTAQLYLHRIIQELIHNAFKHSSAWHVWVRLTWEPQILLIEVEDDGTGFSKIPEFIDGLKRKNNTLKMRSRAIGASIRYHHGQRGLLATIQYPFSSELL